MGELRNIYIGNKPKSQSISEVGKNYKFIKIMKKLLLFTLIFLATISVFSQDSIVIRGEVIEKLTKSIIPNASITVKIDSVLHETISNQRGGFFLRLPKAISYSLSIQQIHFLNNYCMVILKPI